MTNRRRLRAWLVRLWQTVRPGRDDRDLEDELRLHLELAAEDARRGSDAPETAARAARIQEGALGPAIEVLRDQRRLPWLDDLWSDLRFGVRGLVRNPGFTAVGQRLLFERGDDTMEVVGVVGDVKYQGFDATESRPGVYLPLRQVARPPLPTVSISIRRAGDLLAVVPFLREAVAEVHPRAALDDVMTMDARLSVSVAQPRFFAVFVGGFAAIAVFLATFGIFGVLAYTVAQRRREIGVRMAMGAQRADIVGLVVRQGAILVAAGAVVGLVAAAALTPALASLLFGVTATDLPTFVASAALLIGVGLVACYLPARRATRIDPMVALRHE